MNEKRIGIDFDNTIASYCGVFYRAARERNLIPKALSSTKDSVRDYLRSIGKEEVWTELQGYIYGARMDLACPHVGVATFFKRSLQEGDQTFIVSHKTKTPYVGPKYDLHRAAKRWLQGQSFPAPPTFFEPTLREKLARIRALGCTHFIDDLPELLADDHFPHGVQKILFDPTGSHHDTPGQTRITSWDAITQLLYGQ